MIFRRMMMITLLSTTLCASDKKMASNALKHSYDEITKALVPQPRPSHAMYEVARLASKTVPIGLAAVGTHSLLKGDYVMGGGLLAGSLGTSLLRTYLLRRLVQVGVKKYQESLKAFLASWPTRRVSAPESLQGMFDTLYEEYTHNPDYVMTPLQAQAIADGIHALALVDHTRKNQIRTDEEKWQFVREQIGIVDTRSGRDIFVEMAARKAALTRALIQYLSVGIVGGAFTTLRVPKVRRYILGVKELGGDFVLDHIKDKPEIDKEFASVPRLPLLNQRLLLALGVSGGLGLIGFIAHFIITTVGLNRSAQEARNAKLDTFMSVWQEMKEHAPQALHSRFDELYTKFDAQTRALLITPQERTEFIAAIERDNPYKEEKKEKKKVKNTRNKRGKK